MTDYNEYENSQLENLCVDIEVAVGDRDCGTITIEFWPSAAPTTVRNFLRYASEGFYDGKNFHRVISGFMIQGGCPLGTGTGSGDYGMIPGEFNSDKQYTHCRGVISMARSQDPNSASCQFFICHGDADFLDNQYAAFGAMIDGDSALDAVAAVQTTGAENSTPVEKCTIKKMSVREKATA
ncbi:MAG: peptidylprolyl isomerase [Planctomycetota bacterium]|jgi:peptidyl-prolyl cis-trans isomerase B (cyclophilin B)|nr:peptidylprolyl isomerase [Planctomycetota bacterium]MDP6940741.1 peptidylprolyl isomerase [Planctomycetota bacterium]